MTKGRGNGLRALVVDDEAPARRRLARLLEVREEVGEVRTCRDAAAALEAVEATPADAIFLDIRMPGLSGFELLERLPDELAPALVFVTAFDEHAVRAFRARALDYILKPATEDDVDEALFRIREYESARAATPDPKVVARALREVLGANTASMQEDEQETVSSPEQARWLVSSGSRSFVLDPRDIDWIEAAGNYVRLVVGTETYLVRGSLSAYEEATMDVPFVRIHRSTIVNLDRISEIKSRESGTGTVLLHDGTELALSRRYRRRLERWLSPPG